LNDITGCKSATCSSDLHICIIKKYIKLKLLDKFIQLNMFAKWQIISKYLIMNWTHLLLSMGTKSFETKQSHS
jgi:hypothetical protein